MRVVSCLVNILRDNTVAHLMELRNDAAQSIRLVTKRPLANSVDYSIGRESNSALGAVRIEVIHAKLRFRCRLSTSILAKNTVIISRDRLCCRADLNAALLQLARQGHAVKIISAIILLDKMVKIDTVRAKDGVNYSDDDHSRWNYREYSLIPRSENL